MPEDTGSAGLELAASVASAVAGLRFDSMGADDREGWLRTFSSIDGAVAAGRSRALGAAAGDRPRGAAERSAELVRATGMSDGDARRAVRLADTLEAVPAAAEALAAGEITSGHAAALSSGVPWLYRSAIGSDPTLLAAARNQTVDEFTTTISTWRQELDGDLDGRWLAARQHRDRQAGWSIRADGMVHLHARLAPDAGSLLTGALHALSEHLWRTQDDRSAEPGRSGSGDDPAINGDEAGSDIRALQRTTAQRQADALVELARRATDPAVATEGRPRVDLLVAVELDALTTGPPARRVRCPYRRRRSVGPCRSQTVGLRFRCDPSSARLRW